MYGQDLCVEFQMVNITFAQKPLMRHDSLGPEKCGGNFQSTCIIFKFILWNISLGTSAKLPSGDCLEETY